MDGAGGVRARDGEAVTGPHYIGTLCAGAVASVAVACAGSQSYEKPPTPVQVAEVRRQPVRQPLRYSAIVEPARRVDLAFRVSGYVIALAQIDGRSIDDGDRVDARTILAWVRSDDYDERIRQTEAPLAEAEAARRAASLALTRAEALYAARSITKPELEQAQAAVDAIDAKIAGARAAIRAAQLTRGDTTLRTPMTGVVLKRVVEVGSLVAPGALGFVIADTRAVKVVIGVPDMMLPRFPTRAIERVTSDALPDRRFEGRVSKVSPTADPRSRLFEVEIIVPNGDGTLRPGMVATVHVADDQSSLTPMPVVPLSAVIRAGGDDEFAVLVVVDHGGVSTARRQHVRLGELIDNQVSVIEGLVGGERVIVQGGAMVADGERVNPTP